MILKLKSEYFLNITNRLDLVMETDADEFQVWELKKLFVKIVFKILGFDPIVV